MKNTSKKFWLFLLLFIACLVALASTSLMPVLTATQSKVTRLYPDDSTHVVHINQMFVYELPAESRGFPFGLHCQPSSPSLLEENQSLILSTTMHNGQTVGIMPDLVNDILLTPNSRVVIRITGICYFPLRPLGDARLFEYFISQETFQVGETRHPQDEINRVMAEHIDDKFLPDFFEQFPRP